MPVLIAWSDNGTEMTAIDTRKFMALMAITQHHGRPGNPTDQAHIESFYSHLKGDWPHLTTIRDHATPSSPPTPPPAPGRRTALGTAAHPRGRAGADPRRGRSRPSRYRSTPR